jgi:hypothetical protein
MKESHGKAYEIDKLSLAKWIRRTLQFTIPSLIVFVGALSYDSEASIFILTPAFIASIQDLLTRYLRNYE